MRSIWPLANTPKYFTKRPWSTKDVLKLFEYFSIDSDVQFSLNRRLMLSSVFIDQISLDDLDILFSCSVYCAVDCSR